MDDGFAFFDIIIFAMLAGYLVFQLRRVLGRRADQEKPRENVSSSKQDTLPENDSVVPFKEEDDNIGSVSTDPVSGLTMLRRIDQNFNDKEFIDGSKSAFSWIVTAFAKGEISKLKPLLSANLWKSFEKAIQRRVSDGEILETTIVSFKSVLINDATINDANVNLTVEFVSDQVKVLRGRDEKILEGNPDVIETITDLWTFNRDVKSSNPNWILVKTETPTDTK
jgi:predicted lipid-binding transport protein (Tim44 family)